MPWIHGVPTAGTIPPVGGMPAGPTQMAVQPQPVDLGSLLDVSVNVEATVSIGDLTWEVVHKEYPLVSGLLEFHLDTSDRTPQELTPVVESLVREVVTARVSDATSKAILGEIVTNSENFFLIAALPSYLDFAEHRSGWDQLENLCSFVDVASGESWRSEDKLVAEDFEATDDNTAMFNKLVKACGLRMANLSQEIIVSSLQELARGICLKK